MPEGVLGAAIGPLIMIILSLVGGIFWLVMFIDCIKREFKDPNAKIAWIAAIFFGSIIGAFIYWIIVKSKK